MTTTELKFATQRPRKMARKPKAVSAEQGGTTTAAPIKRESKAELVLGMLQRSEGTTIEQMVAVSGWLPHTTRAALTGLKKKGHVVTSEKLEGEGRVYRVTVA